MCIAIDEHFDQKLWHLVSFSFSISKSMYVCMFFPFFFTERVFIVGFLVTSGFQIDEFKLTNFYLQKRKIPTNISEFELNSRVNISNRISYVDCY